MNDNEPGDHSVLAKGLAYAAATAAVLLLGYLYFDEEIEKQFNPNQNPPSNSQGKQTSVTLQRNKFGHYVSSGVINGEPVVFFLDTGATDVSIPASVAGALGLKKGVKHRVNTANGTVHVFSTQLQTVELGGIKLRNVDANINPFMDGEAILLGMSFLGELDFSQRGDVLTLQQLGR